MTEAGRNVFDIVVVGGGLVGLTTALSLSRLCKKRRLKIGFVAPAIDKADGRTTALLMPSVHMLQQLGIWERCLKHSAPLRTMRLIDGTNRLIRAPLTDFKAAELELDAFGYNIPNAVLADSLERAIHENGNITRLETSVSSISCGEDYAVLTLDNGRSTTTRLVAAADGRNSPSRVAAGVEVVQWDYLQTAIT